MFDQLVPFNELANEPADKAPDLHFNFWTFIQRSLLSDFDFLTGTMI